MLLHFVRKSARDGFHQPVGEVLSRKVNLFDTYDFVRGSLWDATGQRVSAGMHITDEATTKTHPVFPHRCHFLFGGKQAVARPLTTVIPASSLPENPLHRLFLTTAADNWVLLRRFEGLTILIPCFELLRVLYYEAGPELIEHYFHNQDLAVVCSALEAPTAANQKTGRIRLRKYGFTKRQQDILAELCFNPHSLRNVTAAHSNLKRALLREPQGATPQLDFFVGRPLRLEANGFHFTAGNASYFFVCGLWAQTNPFSFQKLFVTPPPGKQPVGDKEADGEEATRKSALYQAKQKPDTRLNSQEPGSSRYRDATVRTHDKQGVAWPPAENVPSEKERKAGTGTTLARIPRAPDSLSYTLGGNDETRALATPLEGDPHQLSSYFHDFVDWFRQHAEYEVKLLTLHNESGEYGVGICTLSQDDHRGIAVAELRHTKGYFYFLELLAGGRAAFVHNPHLTQLVLSDFTSLFSSFKRFGLNWLTYKQHLTDERKPKDTPNGRKVLGDFVIQPRNRHNGALPRQCFARSRFANCLFFRKRHASTSSA
ncbi:hypothetical protein [Hymenobacter sp. BRD67]|uniref:hypothetical protein n=1 Tax=Hymenobacter sp. BRD67 TaxID=2675877 RepID=UPI001565C208|nr:hypothetical protein [Hymenobacter sp. BRD67]QKG51840.1 hypothetical protein GKZ67_03495 [Hymenobacter sp. BRD67]